MNKTKIQDEISDHYDKCTLELRYCGNRISGGLCLSKDRCAYHLSEKWLSSHVPKEKSTIETIIEIESKRNKSLTTEEVLAMTPNEEIDNETGRYIIDFKGNVFDIKKHRVIQRNFKL